ncbi:MAG: hypothetical protein ACRC5T_06640 [Cetobacterium sp.]
MKEIYIVTSDWSGRGEIRFVTSSKELADRYLGVCGKSYHVERVGLNFGHDKLSLRGIVVFKFNHKGELWNSSISTNLSKQEDVTISTFNNSYDLKEYFITVPCTLTDDIFEALEMAKNKLREVI